jgi:signal transduction histidine kinase
MNILLFSNDEKLAGFCREILAEMFGRDSRLDIGLPGQLPSQEDLCLWDFIPGETAIPRELDPGKLPRHLFLVQRKHLPALHELVGTSDINVLLKPVMPATLRAFLGDAHQQRARDNGNAAKSVDALRVERDDMLQFLIQANLKLQEYDQERTNFLARSIHDFRAPLTAISGYCGLLLEEELGALTPDQREVLGRMQQSATRLSRITNSMFQLSIRQSVDQELNLKQADMRDCVDQALHEVALFLEDKRIAIRVEIEKPPEGLFFDPSQMEQTLVNLLDNARKFTPRNGAIEIRGYPFFWERRTCRAAPLDPSADRRVTQARTPNSFRVDIRDSGPGIPAVHVGKIFEEYSSYSGGQDRSGGGLGLAICRMILQQHRGRVWAESHAAGAVFSFVLPVQPAGTRVPGGTKGLAKACLVEVEEGWS